MTRCLLFLCALVCSQVVFGQRAKEYRVAAVGFYNVENLFDTLDTPGVRDTEFSPTGSKLYDGERYRHKLDQLASVIGQLGTETTPDGLAVLGVAEIENRSVLEDLVAHEKLADRRYGIVHFDSPDKRGIDVGLLYNPKYFLVDYAENIPIEYYEEDGDTLFTRDILWVKGQLEGEEIHFFVNHWPSRRGGEKRSQPKRNFAALTVKKRIDLLKADNPDVKVVVMGDLNDNPTSPSVKKILRARRSPEEVRRDDMYNPMWALYQKGIGSNAWRDTWSLFDQMLVSPGLVGKRTEGYRFYKPRVYNERHMAQATGQFRGYPFRSFVGDTYQGGFSDHFPVYILLVKEAS